MTDIVAMGAISALGTGVGAFSPGRVGAPAETCIRRDEELGRAGLRKPFAARVDLRTSEDRALALLRSAARDLARDLDRALPGWRRLRVGACLGTSGGGMQSLLEALALHDAGQSIPPELARRAPYFGPLAALAEMAVNFEPLSQVLAACASSTFALGLGCRFIEQDLADLVIAGGYDALSPFIAAGFECLGATSERPMPFRRTRDGLALGEGAALVALARPSERVAPLARIMGFGASSDAVHITAPDRTGAGLARAARRALADSGSSAESIALVSAHGTGTSYNDSAESIAISQVLGEHASEVVIHPFKATIGHTLGAAGALETLAAASALEQGVEPATFGSGEIESELRGRLLDRGLPGTGSRCLKLSSAFGGANAALIVDASPSSRSPRPIPRSRRAVRLIALGPLVSEASPAELAGRVAVGETKLARMDEVSLLVVAAASMLAPFPEEAGVVVGSATTTIDIDADFERRRRSRGPEPRRFPATSPNLCAGECSIAFGLLGPSFSVGADPAAPIEALAVAHDLLCAGDAELLLVVAVESGGELARALWRAAGWPAVARGAAAVLLGVSGAGAVMDRGRLGKIQARARAAGGLLDGASGAPALLRAAREVSL